ncbi:MAG: hypothetical protein QME68_07400 [Elusimicrobiota bacterium]|nr:hypothetical protein [Elusimicrobiota bacterium]
MVKKCVIVLYLMVSFTVSVFAQKASTGWWIFRRAQSIKPKAITAVAAVRGDLSGVFYNPSILGTLQEREIFMLTELGLAKDTFGGLLYGQPLKIGKGSGISAGVVYYDAGKETLYYMEGGKEEKREVTVQRDILGIVSYGQKFSESILAGATVKFANSNIAEIKSANAYAGDLGVIFIPSVVEGLTLSLVGQNLGFSTKFINKAEELPMSVWFGTSYTKKLGNSYLCFGAELPYIIKEQRTLSSIGIEYGTGQFAVNLGYRFGAEDALLHLGFDITVSNFDFGYAFIPATYLYHTHRLNIGYRF